MKKSTEIRQDFLDFFASKGHKIVPSAPVVPQGDPTLLFVNAGMNQFKDIFLGVAPAKDKRIVDTQKCIRVSGKHNDLEEVGHDGYHHTFFEMLGNWSFGDYYKKEAIQWAWEILTKVWGLDKKRLWVTYFREDAETKELWETLTDIEPSHILKFDEKDNFWEMGDTGPCGPCSEMHYDFTPEGCKASDVNADNPDVMEIWNLVFIQYNRDSNGQLDELPQKHVDTGMGFERIVRVLQNKSSNYLTDVFLPLINELINITGKEYSGRYEAPMNVIADHVRTLTFAIGDGAIPSNEGRGYVLRRVLRRAARYGRNLDMRTPFIYKLVDTLVDTMGLVFPEIVDKREFIKEVIKGEEESFNITLDKGLALFNGEVERMKSAGEKTFSGEVAFKLHDTYGFPVDLTQLMAREINYSVDMESFSKLMNDQRLNSSGGIGEMMLGTDENLESTLTGKHLNTPNEFVGYNNLISESIVEDFDIGDFYEQLYPGHKNFYHLVLNKTPLYSKSGGQAADKGILIIDGKEYGEIDGGSINKHGKRIHRMYDYFGPPIERNTKVVIKVVDEIRHKTERNHSATHLVHEAIRRVLGPHIKQMGSYLDDQLLRFDFPHFHKLTDTEIKLIEDIVNKKIKEGMQVEIKEMELELAKKLYPNLRMFFTDKYGEKVRVVIIDKDFSVELCGGTHVTNTKDIGFFKIVKEESIATGTRRITAVTWDGQIKNLEEEIQRNEKVIQTINDKLNLLRVSNRNIVNLNVSKVEKVNTELNKYRKNLFEIKFGDGSALATITGATAATTSEVTSFKHLIDKEDKQLEKELAKQKIQEASGSIDELIKSAVDVSGIKLIKGKFDVSTDELKDIGDKLREKMGSGVGLLYAVIDDKVGLCAVVSDDLVKDKKLSAGKIAGDVAKILGGGGGGKPHLATAGGKDVSKINEALEALPGIIQKYL